MALEGPSYINEFHLIGRKNVVQLGKVDLLSPVQTY